MVMECIIGMEMLNDGLGFLVFAGDCLKDFVSFDLRLEELIWNCSKLKFIFRPFSWIHPRLTNQ